MGGSAGSLEAFEQFFSHMPTDSGSAFVLVPHLDPSHKGIMPELLQRCTTMPVIQAEDAMAVRPNAIYIIPPNKDMSILRGSLYLHEPAAPRGWRTPIDFFLRHLAEDQGERAVAVILSGMGTDGTLGVKAVKEHLGLAMVQESVSAKYNSMPKNAIGTGLVDYVAAAENLPGKLISYMRHTSKQTNKSQANGRTISASMSKILVMLRAHTGHDFSFYKKNTLFRRVERRMNVNQLSNVARYAQFLRERPPELDLLFKELLIGVTNFFRDKEAFHALRSNALPELLKSKAPGGLIRVWVPGCSTGEEPYSIAILVRGCLEDLGLEGKVKVPNFCDGYRQGRRGKSAAGPVPSVHRPRYLSGTDASLLSEGRRGIPSPYIDQGDDRVCPAGRHHGSALYQIGFALLPKPADLLHDRAAEKGDPTLSLHAEPRRDPVPRLIGNHRFVRRSLHDGGQQMENLQTQGTGLRATPVDRSSRRPRERNEAAAWTGAIADRHLISRRLSTVAYRSVCAGFRARERSGRYLVHSWKDGALSRTGCR
jgi:hypothetical protein